MPLASLPDLQPYLSALPATQQVIRSLEREKNRFASEAAAVNEKYAAAVEEVALHDSAILDLQRKIAGECVFVLSAVEDLHGLLRWG
jgi:uncharacterized protein involved in exopolysaccharide biosynthesis